MADADFPVPTKMGPPTWEPTAEERRLVEHHMAMGHTQEQTARLMGKSVDSLDRHCRDELDLGKMRTNAKVGGKLYQKCMDGDTACLIFWAKTQMGWKETDRHEVLNLHVLSADGLPPGLRFLRDSLHGGEEGTEPLDS